MCHSVFGLLGDCVCNACPTQSATKARLLTMVFTPAFIPLMQIANRSKATCGLPLWMLRVCVCPGLWWSHDPSDWGNGTRVFGAVVITQHIRVGAGGGAPVFRAVVITQHFRVEAGVGNMCLELWWSHNTSGWGQGWGTCVWSCGDHTTHQGGGTCVQSCGDHTTLQGGGTCVQSCGDHTTHQGGGRGWGTCVQSCGDHTTLCGGSRGWGMCVQSCGDRMTLGDWGTLYRVVVITWQIRVGAGGRAHACTELWWSQESWGGWGGEGGHLHIQSSGDSMTCWGGGRGWGTYIYRAVMITWHVGVGVGWMCVQSCGDHLPL